MSGLETGDFVDLSAVVLACVESIEGRNAAWSGPEVVLQPFVARSPLVLGGEASIFGCKYPAHSTALPLTTCF